MLSLSNTDLFRTRWTSRIQGEWLAAVLDKKPQFAEALQRTRQFMEEAVPDANVTGYETLEQALTLPDPDDRHVLAAAIVGRADVIVTLNSEAFPFGDFAPFNIEAQHPDEFIAHVLTLDMPMALGEIRVMRARLRNPPFTPEEFLDLLARQGLPQTVEIVRESVALI